MPTERRPVPEYKKSDWLKKPSQPGGKSFKWHTVLPSEPSFVKIGKRPEVSMTWEELTHFNWGTKVPAEINWYLKEHVGCKGVTADGKNYYFKGGEKIWLPDKSPPASPAAPTTHSAPKTSSKGSSSSTVAITYRKGDILLRAGEEVWIMEITGGPYSHAGTCVNGASEQAVDAHPEDAHRTEGNEVAQLPISDFFSVAHAAGGGDVFRYTGPKSNAEAAAKWAEAECGKAYVFDLWDPIVGPSGNLQNNNQLYCSEFVWRCYRTGAGVTLVDPKDFINLKDKKVYDRNIEILTEVAKREGEIPKYVPGPIARKLVKKEFKNHNGRFLAPIQLADSPSTKKVKSIRGGAKMPTSSSSTSSSGKK